MAQEPDLLLQQKWFGAVNEVKKSTEGIFLSE